MNRSSSSAPAASGSPGCRLRLRRGLRQDLGMNEESWRENVRRIGEVAKLMVDAGLIVIVSAILPYREDRDAVRRHFAEGQFIDQLLSQLLETRPRSGAYQAFTGSHALER